MYICIWLEMLEYFTENYILMLISEILRNTDLSISVISATASFEAVGMMEASGVAVNWGNLKFMLAASLWPSGHSLESGVPSTEQILNISSISELPGNSGLKQPLLLETSLLREQI